MKNTRTSLSAAIALPVIAVFAQPADTIAFSPSEGASVTRTWTSSTQFALDDMEMSMNGQPLPMEMEMEMDMGMDMSVEVTDEYISMLDGQPGALRRSYDVIGSSGSFALEAEMLPGGGDEKTIAASSELEGKVVVFAWNEEDDSYDISYDESEGDEDLLEGLEEDMDLRALLPPEEQEEGGTWEIDVKSLTSVLAPGGDMALVPELDDEDMGMGMPGMENMGRGMNDMLGDLLEGEATGTFNGFQDVDGVRVAVIALVVSIESSNDMTDQVMEAMDEMPEEIGEFSVEYMDVEIEIEAEATLYWDLEAGHAHSYEMNGSMSFITDMGMNVAMGDQEMEIEQTFEMSGTFENTMSIEQN
jgi:hypothetical protein